MSKQLYSVWISTERFWECDDPAYNIVPYFDLTVEEVTTLMQLSLQRGHECIIVRENGKDGDGD